MKKIIKKPTTVRSTLGENTQKFLLAVFLLNFLTPMAFATTFDEWDMLYEGHIHKVEHFLNKKLAGKSNKYSNVSNFTLEKSSCVIKGGLITGRDLLPIVSVPGLSSDIFEIASGPKNILKFHHFNDPGLDIIDDEDMMEIVVEVGTLKPGAIFKVGKDSSKAFFASVDYGGPGKIYLLKDVAGQVQIIAADEKSVAGKISLNFQDGAFSLEGEFELPLIDGEEIINLQKKLRSDAEKRRKAYN